MEVLHTGKLLSVINSYNYFCIATTFLDECAIGTHNCSANATCSDTESGFTCSCNTGYTGDGVTCSAEVCSENCCFAGGISHSMPTSDYICTEASFGIVVTKKTAPAIGYTAATDYCAADGAMVHLPAPKNEAENLWYNSYMFANYEVTGTWAFVTGGHRSFWLGVNDANIEGRGDSASV